MGSISDDRALHRFSHDKACLINYMIWFPELDLPFAAANKNQHKIIQTLSVYNYDLLAMS